MASNARSRRTDPVRRATNVSLPAQAVADAKALGINVSKACEAGLATELKKERERRWLDENREAIAAYNAWLEDNDLPLSHLPPL